MTHEQRERMHRLAEIVARCGEEAGLRLVGEREVVGALGDARFLHRMRLLQSLGHAVELDTERLELVTGSHVDPLVEIALTKLPGARLEFAYRSHHSSREDDARRDGGNSQRDQHDRPRNRCINGAERFVYRTAPRKLSSQGSGWGRR